MVMDEEFLVVCHNQEKERKIYSSQMEQCKIHDEGHMACMKVTIKDKPTTDSNEADRQVLGNVFGMLLAHARRSRRLCELMMKIQNETTRKQLRKCFEAWKVAMEKSERLAIEKSRERDTSDVKRIELFVDVISEKQRTLSKRPKDPPLSDDGPREPDKLDRRNSFRSTTRTIRTVDSRSLSHLNAQKKIIARQKMKLAEQSRIIEEMRLKQIEEGTKIICRNTVTIAGETLAHCGEKSRRTLMNIVQRGCRGGMQLTPPRIPSPPRFLARMEARAIARRERMKRAEEERKRKLEEENTKLEIEKRQQEENQKRLQLESRREAKRIREETEKKRQQDVERLKIINELADNFYRKYLMRRYVMRPFALLVKMKLDRLKIAENHCMERLLKKSYEAWKTETTIQREIKMELSASLWRKNVLWYAFRDWLESTRIASKKLQVATDYREMRLQEMCLKIWYERSMTSKIEHRKNQDLADEKNNRRLLNLGWRNWKKYLSIKNAVEESDRRRDEWRKLVKRVVPDFDPLQRGVAIDDY